MHRNPVKRGLVVKPEDWPWSSFRHYMTGTEGVVEIESEWTGRKRERMGIPLRVRVTELPHPSKTGLGGAPPPVPGELMMELHVEQSLGVVPQ